MRVLNKAIWGTNGAGRGPRETASISTLIARAFARQFRIRKQDGSNAFTRLGGAYGHRTRSQEDCRRSHGAAAGSSDPSHWHHGRGSGTDCENQYDDERQLGPLHYLGSSCRDCARNFDCAVDP